MHALNLALLQWLAAGAQPTPWVLMCARTLALGGSWMCAAVALAALWRRPDDRAYLVAVGLLAGLASMLSHAIALRLNVPRPFAQGLVPAYITHAVNGSLPSTHASVMFTVALAFLARTGLRAIGVPLFLLAAATGWGRIYTGVHFPFDIAAGLLLAAALVGALGTAQWLAHRAAVRAATRATASAWRPS
ncbi:phosphoesterase PA-phosphatase [Variovorax paradoxus]|jgi:undecaprenyl-diphosphatase|uniref:phosphatase PAP2 family protein n=1 Tax=Variovorax TaxID=34072 RepID=UPI0006E73593|nr:phosphatase PAP2 family protein [Variovorax boronicumulans]KPU88283.1 phosphoesterase PA-phosphatase [Variovorax paradoxus]KPU88467.1 phosphoesterase PA-phosphatase [Variovorax paradoxus]KPV15712.1 phosphoesterase PA-phosphatase [Variovorax paradoxus]KPV15911.1 phosphoesterase PA-phosphatase [Variovorax paradoxus]GER21460.1 phosphatase PAP2 family protein [Variovorax boronicumulans]